MTSELKPLEWKQNGTREGSVLARIDAVNLSYTIEPKSNIFRLKHWQFRIRHVYDDLGLFPTLEGAKAAAQADLEARIAPLIAARPDTTHTDRLVEALREADKAATELLDGAQDTYRAGNNRQIGIQADDGEKCLIVHSDLMTQLERARDGILAALSNGEDG